MKSRSMKIVRIAAASMFVVIIFSLAAPAAEPGDIVGDWAGVLRFSGMEMRIVFHFTLGEAGTLAATMDSPDQGAAGIPTSGVSFDGDSLAVEVAVSQGGYYAKYYPDSLYL